MKKLNEKGFAFSTMLYGTLALLTLTLYVILDVSKTSYDETYLYGETVDLQLMECTQYEVELEKCYATGNPYCDMQVYHNCLGVSDDTTTPQGTLLSTKLKNAAVTTGNGLYRDGTSLRYYYKGDTVNNYINYLGKKWRIVSIEENGTIKLLDYSNPIQMRWHTGGIGGLIWEKIQLNRYLNNDYLATLSGDPVLGEWKAALLYPSEGTGGNGAYKLTDFERQREAQGEFIKSYAKAGVLSVDDYIRASSNANCQNNMLATTNCNSWLAAYGGWTNNIDAEKAGYINNGVVVQDPTNNSTLMLTNYVYYFDNSTKSIITLPAGEIYTFYPVIYLNRNSLDNGGSGTLASPFEIK